jgi:exonuclease SbcC
VRFSTAMRRSRVISRLRSLQVANFRRIAGSHAVPLDADIVVVYGPNGSGKTSLMQALELAITGSVEDLRGSNDYPRVLQNQFSSDPMRVSLDCETPGGKTISVGPHRQGRHDGEDQLRRYFAERAYLSQRQLTRLLESYQTLDKSKAGDDQVLAQFIQRLLQLDDLMNLADGLHPALDRRRLRNLVPTLVQLESEEARVKELAENAAAEMSALQRRVKDASSKLVAWCVQLGVQAPDDPAALDDAVLGSWLQTVDSQARDLRATDTAQLQTLDNLRAATQRCRTAEGKDLEGDRQLLDAQAAIAARETDLADTRHKLNSIRRLLESTKAQTVRLSEVQLPDSSLDDVGFLDVLDGSVKRALPEAHSMLEFVQSSNERLNQVRHELAEVEESSTLLAAQSRDQASRSQQLLSLLLASVDSISGDVCPVCARDYGETGRGGLRDHVDAEIQLLREANEEAAYRAEALQSALGERDRLRVELEATEARVSAAPEVQAVQARCAALAEIDAIVGETAGARARASAGVQEIAKLRLEAERIENAQRQATEARRELARIREEAHLPKADPGMALHEIGASTETGLRDRRDEVDTHRRMLSDLLALRGECSEATSQLSSLGDFLAASEARLAGVSQKLREVWRLEQSARSIAEASSRARAEALNQAIQGDLNTLWQDLFVRLAPSEPFVPELSSASVERRRLMISALVGANGVDAMDSEATLSAGNLNTAALCLFLALSMVEAPVVPLLILDDPIQSMDDIHLLNFAGLLSTLARDAGRQVVVTVHEKALFEYLIHELGPTRQSDTLLGLELSSIGEDRWSFQETRRQWQADEIRVG